MNNGGDKLFPNRVEVKVTFFFNGLEVRTVTATILERCPDEEVVIIEVVGLGPSIEARLKKVPCASGWVYARQGSQVEMEVSVR
jgi:hypothetical protein